MDVTICVIINCFEANNMNNKNYKISFSFASEQRQMVKDIVYNLLVLGFSKEDIFYDKFHELEINGSDADIKLENIYAKQSTLVVVVISKEYLEKEWTRKIEWRAIRILLNSKESHRVCLFNADGSDISKLEGLHYTTDIAKNIYGISSYEIAAFVKDKYNLVINYINPKTSISNLEDKQAEFLDKIIEIVKVDEKKYHESTELIENFLFRGEKNITLEQIANLILNSDSTFPVSFFGKYGTGKSTLFTLLYYYFIRRYYEQKLLYPILIDLNNLNQMKKEKARELLSRFVACVEEHIFQNESTHYLLMVDGINEYSDNHAELDDIIETFISTINSNNKYNGRFTFCIGEDDSLPDTIREESSLKSYLPKSEIKIEVRPLSKGENLDGVFNDKFKSILATMNRLYNYGILENDIEKIYKASSPYITNHIDYRTLHIILRIYRSHEPSTNFTIGLKEYFLKKLSKPKDFYLAARHTYDVFILKKTNQKVSSFHNINAIVFASRLSIDFFIAVHFVNILIGKNEIAPGSLGKDIVFTALTNKFIKDLIFNLDKSTQTTITKKIIEAYVKENSDTIKAQYAYLLGRIDETSAQKEAKKFLLAEWEEKYDSLFTNCLLKSDKSVEDGSLVLFRTLSVSLTWVKENSKQELFLKCIIYNERLNAINRGFHLSYYGDRSYINGYDPVYVDDGNIPITYTMAHLISNINLALSNTKMPNKAINLDIITLLTLYQYRMDRDDIIFRYKNVLSDLIPKLIKSPKIQSTTIKNYLTTMLELLDNDISIKEVLSEFYHVKTKPRSGWIKRNVMNPEVIADHMYACFLLGMFFLPNNIQQCIEYDIPDKSEYGDYSKEAILQMLLLHDLAEAKYGDIAAGDKTEKDIVTEKARYVYYQYLCSIPRVYGLGSRKNLMDEFHAKSTINAKIAYDIDKIEPVIQAYFYMDSNPKVDIEEWKCYASERLKTSWGKEFFSFILKCLGIE